MVNIFTDYNLRFDTSLFFKLMFENAKEASILIMDSKGKILDMNIGVHKTYGYAKNDLVGKNFSVIFTDEDNKVRKPDIEIARVIQQGSATDRNYILHKNGARIWSKQESIFTKDDQGEIFIVKVIYDIHEQKLLEQYLIASNEFFEGIIETINHPLVVLDHEMNIIKANKKFYETICMNPSNSEQSVFDTCNGFLNTSEVKTLLADILPKNLSVTDYEIEYNCPQWGKKNFSVNALQFTQGGEKQQKILIDISDITSYAENRIKLESEKEGLDKINKSLDTFIYTASHDLKAPINNIEALLGHLENSIDCPEDCQELIILMKESVDKFKHTIEDLSNIGKAQEESKSNVSVLEFNAMLEEVLFDLHEFIEDSHATIISDFAKAPYIKISKPHLRSILHNLLSNAIKYRSPERMPEVNITTAKSDKNYILLKVSDNGIGIKEQDKTKVFSMYKRLQTDVEGTGVGMAIVARIVANNGGKIELESEFGKGSTFKVYLKT